MEENLFLRICWSFRCTFRAKFVRRMYRETWWAKLCCRFGCLAYAVGCSMTVRVMKTKNFILIENFAGEKPSGARSTQVSAAQHDLCTVFRHYLLATNYFFLRTKTNIEIEKDFLTCDRFVIYDLQT